MNGALPPVCTLGGLSFSFPTAPIWPGEILLDSPLKQFHGITYLGDSGRGRGGGSLSSAHGRRDRRLSSADRQAELSCGGPSVSLEKVPLASLLEAQAGVRGTPVLTFVKAKGQVTLRSRDPGSFRNMPRQRAVFLSGAGGGQGP